MMFQVNIPAPNNPVATAPAVAPAVAVAVPHIQPQGMTVQVSVLTYFLLVCHISKPKNPSALETSTLLQPELTAIYHIS